MCNWLLIKQFILELRLAILIGIIIYHLFLSLNVFLPFLLFCKLSKWGVFSFLYLTLHTRYNSHVLRVFCTQFIISQNQATGLYIYTQNNHGIINNNRESNRVVCFDGHLSYQEMWVGQISGERAWWKRDRERDWHKGLKYRNKGYTFAGWHCLIWEKGVKWDLTIVSLAN